MRRPLVALAVLVVTLTAISQATGATTQFTALAKGEFEGASSFKACPTNPALDSCETGRIAGYGKVTQVFTFVSGREVNGCFENTGDVLWTLINDPRAHSGRAR